MTKKECVRRGVPLTIGHGSNKVLKSLSGFLQMAPQEENGAGDHAQEEVMHVDQRNDVRSREL